MHSHTLHSREALDFIYKAARHCSPLRWTLKEGEARYRALHGSDLNLSHGWWTPPLAPLDAFEVEQKQILDLGMRSMVSLTDHDDIEAPMSLQAIDASRRVPISVEWTVPFRGTFFHLGIHNLPPVSARSLMTTLRGYTLEPRESLLSEILTALHRNPEVLIVLNHPLWDEKGIGVAQHRDAVQQFLHDHSAGIHACEINGLRPWSENRQVVDLAQTWHKPVISGGDRHVLEPNATLNVSNASSFEQFVDEIRQGYSHVLITSHYREGHAVRILHNMLDVFRTYENHGRGWVEWSDRVFYQFPDQRIESLTKVFGAQTPPVVGLFAGAMRLAGRPGIRSALRTAMSRPEQVAL